MAQKGIAPYLVVWDDAHGSLGEEELASVVNDKPVRTHTVGWLVGSNKHGVTLCVDIYPEDDKHIHTKCFIPHGMVVRKKKLK